MQAKPLRASVRDKPYLGQVFTPRPIAELMAGMIQSPPSAAVLEPSAGQGIFLDVLAERGFSNLTGFEIDQEIAQVSKHPIRVESFVSARLSQEFDVVIGNPPYVRWRDLPSELREEVRENGLWKERLNSLSDYLAVFIVKSVELLREGGELIFITPSYWMHTMHSRGLREFLSERGFIDTIVHFRESQIFAGVASAILVFRYVRLAPGASPPDVVHLFDYVGPRKVQLPDGNGSPLERTDLFQRVAVPQFRSGEHWTLATETVQKRLESLETSCRRPQAETGALFAAEQPVRLGDVADIANGMVSGLDRAFRLPSELHLESEEYEEATVPVAKAMDLTPYRVERYRRYALIPTGLSERDVTARYPNLIHHLRQFEDLLKQRYSYGRDLPFWEWAFLRSRGFFTREEAFIAVPCKERISHKQFVRFALADPCSIASQDVTAIRPRPELRESIHYLLALLNSPQLFDWLLHRGLLKGGVLEFSERPLAQMPIRLIDWDSSSERKMHDAITESSEHLAQETDPNAEQTIRHAVAQLLQR
jgi:adenine-specific DNA-methyltransferase